MYKVLYFLPKNYISHWMGILLHLKFPRPISNWLVKAFARAYKIRLDEAEKPVTEYKSIGDLFIRRLKPGVRPIASHLVHPVDAVISQMGVIQNNTLIQAKGKTYSTIDLLKTPDAQAFEGGMFLTYYLCPTDYHRIHSPLAGKITASILIPGKLWPVNSWSVETIKNLFSINERIVTFIETAAKDKVAVVMVGATNVGRVSLAYDKAVISNDSMRQMNRKTYSPSISVHAGDELGTFHMGSTVVLLVDKNIAQKIKNTTPGAVKMGESLD